MGVQVHFKEGNAIKNLLVTPKDKDNITLKSRVIYRYKCDRLESDEEYIGQSARTFGERYKEHLRTLPPSMTMPIPWVIIPGWTTSPFWVGEAHNFARTIKKAMYIRINDPFLKRNVGKCQLSHIWDEVLFSIPALHLSYSLQQLHFLTVLSSSHSLGGQGYRGLTAYVNISKSIGRYMVLHHIIWHQMSLIAQPMVPSVVCIPLEGITFSTDLMKTCCWSW